jgi:hypothetical protein
LFLSTMVAALLMVPLLMDAVLAAMVRDEIVAPGLPLGKESKVVGLWVGYVATFLLPWFCT